MGIYLSVPGWMDPLRARHRLEPRWRRLPGFSNGCSVPCPPGARAAKLLREVTCFTFWRRETCETLCRQAQATEGMHNADVHRTRHRCCDWPDLVGRRDVEVGPPTYRGHENDRDLAGCGHGRAG